ncbi:MAG: 4Fe-4S binding protein [Desulfuromonadales bacterium]|jgi:ferredoxin|nr:4Fe-4S binding protein [Desulfuromonadales bacterium]
MSLQIFSFCTGCGSCISACPEKALSLETEFSHGWGSKQAVFDEQRCKDCGTCSPACPHEAIG